MGQIRAFSSNCIQECNWKHDACIVFSLIWFWTAWSVHSQEINAKQCWAKSQWLCQGAWEDANVNGTPQILQNAKVGHKKQVSHSLKLNFWGVWIITSSQSAFYFLWGINSTWHKHNTNLNSAWTACERKWPLRWIFQILNISAFLNVKYYEFKTVNSFNKLKYCKINLHLSADKVKHVV